MDPSRVFCGTETCPDKGRVGAGNIRIHSQKKGRYRCTTGTTTRKCGHAALPVGGDAGRAGKGRRRP